MTPAEWASDLEAAFLHCRDVGHSWDGYTASYDAKSRSYRRVLRCSSCLTERVQVLDSRGEVVKNGYRYEKGYLLPPDVKVQPGRTVSRSTFRLAMMTRMTR